MNDQEQEYLDKQEEQNLRTQANQTALRAAAEHKQRTVHNENFLNELRKADLDPDDDAYNFSVEDEFSHWFSGAKAVTNRGDEWDLQADLIMQNKRERAVAERRPGRLLRDRPFLRASMQGADSPSADAYARDDIPGDREYWISQTAAADTATAPVTSRQYSQIFGGAEVAADLMTLSRNGAGLDSVSTVKTETTTRREEEEDSTASRVGRILE
jgi:filamentous hemagglutinin family protein